MTTTVTLHVDGSAETSCGVGESPAPNLPPCPDLCMAIANKVAVERNLSLPQTVTVTVDWTSDTPITVEVQ